jgi:hypothetical protein
VRWRQPTSILSLTPRLLRRGRTAFASVTGPAAASVRSLPSAAGAKAGQARR